MAMGRGKLVEDEECCLSPLDMALVNELPFTSFDDVVLEDGK